MPTTLSLVNSTALPVAEISVPSSLADVLLVEYLAILNGAQDMSIEQRLTGLSAEHLNQLADEDRQRLTERLGFVFDTQQLEEKLPTPGLYEVGNCAYSLFEQARKQLATMLGASALDQGAVLYAHFYNPTATTGQPAAVEAAYAALLDRPVTEVYADCLHFYHSYQRATQGQTVAGGPVQPGLLRLERASPASSAPSLGRRALNALFAR